MLREEGGDGADPPPPRCSVRGAVWRFLSGVLLLYVQYVALCLLPLVPTDIEKVEVGGIDCTGEAYVKVAVYPVWFIVSPIIRGHLTANNLTARLVEREGGVLHFAFDSSLSDIASRASRWRQLEVEWEVSLTFPLLPLTLSSKHPAGAVSGGRGRGETSFDIALNVSITNVGESGDAQVVASARPITAWELVLHPPQDPVIAYVGVDRMAALNVTSSGGTVVATAMVNKAGAPQVVQGLRGAAVTFQAPPTTCQPVRDFWSNLVVSGSNPAGSDGGEDSGDGSTTLPAPDVKSVVLQHTAPDSLEFRVTLKVPSRPGWSTPPAVLTLPIRSNGSQAAQVTVIIEEWTGGETAHATVNCSQLTPGFTSGILHPVFTNVGKIDLRVDGGVSSSAFAAVVSEMVAGTTYSSNPLDYLGRVLSAFLNHDEVPSALQQSPKEGWNAHYLPLELQTSISFGFLRYFVNRGTELIMGPLEGRVLNSTGAAAARLRASVSKGWGVSLRADLQVARYSPSDSNTLLSDILMGRPANLTIEGVLYNYSYSLPYHIPALTHSTVIYNVSCNGTTCPQQCTLRMANPFSWRMHITTTDPLPHALECPLAEPDDLSFQQWLQEQRGQEPPLVTLPPYSPATDYDVTFPCYRRVFATTAWWGTPLDLP